MPSGLRDGVVPLVDLKAQLEGIRDQIDQAIKRVVERQDFILGGELAAFEQAFARAAGCAHAAGVATGTDAIELALRAVGVGPGDEVITSAHSFLATVLGIERSGARPVLVDCEPRGYALDVTLVDKAVSSRTRAILPVHLYGQPVDLRPIAGLCRERSVSVVEDACQAHGAALGGVPVGALGEAAAFSFYPGKNLGAYGDGGAVTTNRADLHTRLVAMRNYGSPIKYQHPVWGTNSRLDEMQAAILSTKLPHLDHWNAARAHAAHRYHERLADLEGIVLPETLPDRRHAWHLYVVRIQRTARERVLAYLHEHGVGAAVHYPTPLHLHGATAHLGYAVGSFPEAESVAREVVSLPLYAEITEAQQDRVAETFRRALA